MDKLVLDACSLIYITKISIKKLVIESFTDIMISEAVKKEVLFDINRYFEAKTINQNIISKNINLKSISTQKLSNNLGIGETEAISLAKSEHALLITDDKLPLRIALNFGLKVKTTETLLLYLLKEKKINFIQFKEKLNNLNQIKTLKPEVYSFILKEGVKYK